MEKLYTGVVDSPVGPLYLARTGDALVRLDFGPDGITKLLHSGAFIQAGGDMPFSWTNQIGRYFEGSLRQFDIPLDLRGTPFEKDVWTALQAIPYGETVTYAQVAQQTGRPKAARAVGRANGKNPVAVIVPCHRVVAAQSLGGYSAGLGIKRALLALEARAR